MDRGDLRLRISVKGPNAATLAVSKTLATQSQRRQREKRGGILDAKGGTALLPELPGQRRR